MTDPEPPEAVPDAFLDRLVDGELSPSELRAAVRILEGMPDGWKRCALAFLEAKAWRESLRSMPVAVGTVAYVMKNPAVPTSSRRPASPWRMAMAAGLAGTAFLLGWRLHLVRSPERGATAASDGVAAKPIPEARTIVPDEAIGPEPVSPVATIDSPAGAPTVAAPTVPQVPERWAFAPPMPLTEHQQALLEQQGYQVDRRRRLVPAKLRDGRRIAVPVDQVQVRYIGLESL